MSAFDNIPEEILLYLSTFLPNEDGIYFSSTCQRLRKIFLNLRLEEHSQHIHLPDLKAQCPYGRSWQPEQYTETPPFTSYIHNAAISCIWKEQGWGRKGQENKNSQIYLQLIRPILNGNSDIDVVQKRSMNAENRRVNTEILVTEHTDLFGRAPDQLQNAFASLTWEDPVISLALPGDYFRFMMRIGGRNEPKLRVNNFSLEIRRIVKRCNITDFDRQYISLGKYRTIFLKSPPIIDPLPPSVIRTVTITGPLYRRPLASKWEFKIDKCKWRRCFTRPNIPITNVMVD